LPDWREPEATDAALAAPRTPHPINAVEGEWSANYLTRAELACEELYYRYETQQRNSRIVMVKKKTMLKPDRQWR